MNCCQIVGGWNQATDKPGAWNKVFQIDKNRAENQGTNYNNWNSGEIKLLVAAENIQQIGK